MKPEDVQLAQDSGQDLFVVKGEPNIGLSSSKDNFQSSLETILKQKLEEINQRKKLENKPVTGHPGAEFKPENMPYIPDSTHPALDKHETATLERNAGFQDRSQEPKEYLVNIKKKEGSKSEVILETIPTNDEMKEVNNETNSKTESETKPKPKQPEFELKVKRENMHKGGHYMPRESRPYRPGD